MAAALVPDQQTRAAAGPGFTLFFSRNPETPETPETLNMALGDALRLDGSCVRRFVDIDPSDYYVMPAPQLRDVVHRMRVAQSDDPNDMQRREPWTSWMKKEALLAEVLERHARFPATCDSDINVGIRFDPAAKDACFDPTLLDEAIRSVPKIHALPDPAIDLIVAHVQRTLPGIMTLRYMNDVQFARPISLTAKGVLTLERLEAIGIGPDVIYPNGKRENLFVPGKPAGTMHLRYEVTDYSRGWTEQKTSRRSGWHMWDGQPIMAWVVR